MSSRKLNTGFTLAFGAGGGKAHENCGLSVVR